ncbi:hypothetical protein ACHAO9_012185, partial [Fusarium lateritium]
YIYTKSVALMVEYMRAIYDLLQTVLPQDKKWEHLSTAKEAAESLSSLLKEKAGSQILNSLRNLYSLQSRKRRAWSNSTSFPRTQQHSLVKNKEIKYCNLTKLHRWIAGSLKNPEAENSRIGQELSSSAPSRLPSSLC